MHLESPISGCRLDDGDESFAEYGHGQCTEDFVAATDVSVYHIAVVGYVQSVPAMSPGLSLYTVWHMSIDKACVVIGRPHKSGEEVVQRLAVLHRPNI